MGILFHAYVAVDDNSQANAEAWSNTPSVWSFDEDYGLINCGERTLFAALGLDFVELGRSRDKPQGFSPLIPLRGVPDFVDTTSATRRKLELENYVGWLSMRELRLACEHAGIDTTLLCKPIRALVEVLQVAEKHYGPERVCVVFSFMP